MANFISGNNDWLDEELAGWQFKDERLGKRFTKLLARMWDGVGESIPFQKNYSFSFLMLYKLIINL